MSWSVKVTKENGDTLEATGRGKNTLTQKITKAEDKPKSEKED